MKKIFIFLVALLISCSTQTTLHKELYKGKEILVGQTTRKSFQQKPYNEWFDANYRDYRPDTEIIKELSPVLNQYDIKIIMGTWCGDSQDQVPVLYKVLDEAGYEKEPEVYCVPREYKTYKPVLKDSIIRVPTIIVLQDGQEKGRIIEYPMKTIEEDLRDILQGNYHHELEGEEY